MNLSEKRRAEKFVREYFDPLLNERDRMMPQVKVPAAIQRKAEAFAKEMEASGFSVIFYQNGTRVTPRSDHPSYVKYREESAARKKALHDQRETLIHGIWSGTIEWDAVTKAIRK